MNLECKIIIFFYFILLYFLKMLIKLGNAKILQTSLTQPTLCKANKRSEEI